MAPCCWATRVISRMTDSVKLAVRMAGMRRNWPSVAQQASPRRHPLADYPGPRDRLEAAVHHIRGRVVPGRPRLFASTLAALVLAVLSTGRGQSAPAPEPRGRPLAIEDFYRIKTVGAPALSPDGAWVAFSVTTRVEATNAETGEVWLVPSDGSRPAARVSPEGSNAGTVRWSDDGQLHFVAG